MSIGRSSVTEEIPKSGAGWAHDVRFWSDRAMTVGPLLDEASAELRRKGVVSAPAPDPVLLTIGNGRVQMASNVCGLRLSGADVAGLVVGDYELVVDVVDDAGWPRQVRKPVRVIA